ncbi:MAG: DUF6455 family protein [Paracoccaceae bacterium]
MIGYTDAPHAWTRAQRMAQAAGLNLASAVVEGWLARRELGLIVARCQSCRKDGACGDWLDQAGQGSKPPAFCGNGAEITALSPG